MFLINYTTCAFSGHRPNRISIDYDEKNQDCIKLKQILKEEILRLIDIGVTRFLSGMSLGVDMWAAEIVIALKRQGYNIKLLCALPCETQADRWDDDDRERYFNILETADEVTYVNIRWTSICMYERNKYLIDHAGYLIAVYDDEPHGGTAQTVNFAKKLNRSIILINPNTFEVTPFLILVNS